MAAKYIILFAACLVAIQAGTVRRDATTITPTEELKKQTTDFAAIFKEQLDRLSAHKEEIERVSEALKKSSEALARKVEELSRNLELAFQYTDDDAKEALNKLTEQLKEIQNDLKKYSGGDVDSSAILDVVRNAVDATSAVQNQFLTKSAVSNLINADDELTAKVETIYNEYYKEQNEIKDELAKAVKTE